MPGAFGHFVAVKGKWYA